MTLSNKDILDMTHKKLRRRCSFLIFLQWFLKWFGGQMPSLYIQQVKTLASVNLTVSGTAEAISGSTVYGRSFTVTAASGNTGVIWVGDSDVAVNRGTPLAAGESVVITPDVFNASIEALIDAADIYIDGDTTNDDVHITYMDNKTVHP